MKFFNDPDRGRSMTALVSSPKQQQLRALNDKNRDLHAALNQARDCIDHAMRLVEDTYLRERREIIDADLVEHGYSDAR
jgi:hypothetical protein